MIDQTERDLFQKELNFLKELRAKVSEEEEHMSTMIEDEITHIESVLNETEVK
ncbi:hypothetical protein ACTHQ4_07225 [Alkalicoccobacillus gibsonii]|uniref:hypothetical protein n=1 Tax=Alkalicoccobacillus gibsonii TaxID=79881 RepID=UPI003F7C9938